MAGIFKTTIYRPTRDKVLYIVLRTVFLSTLILPRKPIIAWHGLLAGILFHFAGRTKETILCQLTKVYGGEKSPGEIYFMAKEVFINLGKTFTDYIFFSQKTSRAQFEQNFKVEGEEHLRRAYEKGKGVICLIPHTCGWEFSAIMPPVLGYETSAVSREIKNPSLNRLMIRLREKRGMKNISRTTGTYEKLIHALKGGDCMIMMIDQDSKKVKGEFLQFLGMKAYTPLGCARLAIETGAAIVPMATFRQPDNTYLFKILPEATLELTGDREYDIRHNTQLHNNIIEEFIREYPSQWIWMHRRWNTTPDNLKAYWKEKLHHRPAVTKKKIPATITFSFKVPYIHVARLNY